MYPFTDVGTEAQRGEMTSSRPDGEVVELAWEPASCLCDLPLLGAVTTLECICTAFVSIPQTCSFLIKKKTTNVR